RYESSASTRKMKNSSWASDRETPARKPNPSRAASRARIRNTRDNGNHIARSSRPQAVARLLGERADPHPHLRTRAEDRLSKPVPGEEPARARRKTAVARPPGYLPRSATP